MSPLTQSKLPDLPGEAYAVSSPIFLGFQVGHNLQFQLCEAAVPKFSHHNPALPPGLQDLRPFLRAFYNRLTADDLQRSDCGLISVNITWPVVWKYGGSIKWHNVLPTMSHNLEM